MVTVIIPTYKRADKIERAIKSVLNQTYKEIELIVVDDNNPDSEDRKNMEIKMKKYEEIPNFKYIKHERNKNGAVARNTGINIAQGEYVTFLDDDDYFPKERIEKLVNLLEENMQYNIAYTGGITCKDDNVICSFKVEPIKDYKKELLLNHSFIGTGSNIFVRSEALKSINGFDETFARHQDIEVLIRLLRNNSIIGLDECLVVKDNSDRNNQPNIENFIKVKKHFFEKFEKDINEYQDSNNIFFENYFFLLKQSVLIKDKKNFRLLKEEIGKYKRISVKENIALFKILIKRSIIKEYHKKIQLNMEEKELFEQFKKADN